MKQQHVIKTAVDARYNAKLTCIMHLTVHVYIGMFFQRPLISRQACIMHLIIYIGMFSEALISTIMITPIVHQSQLLLLLYLLHLHLLHLALHAQFSPPLPLRRVRKNTQAGIAVHNGLLSAYVVTANPAMYRCHVLFM